MLNDISILDYNLNLLQTDGITIPKMGIAQWQSAELLIWQVAGQFLPGQQEHFLLQSTRSVGSYFGIFFRPPPPPFPC